MKNPERWLPVVGYEGCYEVSDLGRVRSVDRYVKGKGDSVRYRPSKMMRLRKYNHRWRVTLSKNGKKRMHNVHQLVLAAFIGPCPVGQVCMHITSVTPEVCDNSLSNLKYGTPSDNQVQRSQEGNHHLRKLTDDQVMEICSRHAAGMSQRKLAKEYGVHAATIRNIFLGRSFSWLTGIPS